MITRVTDTTSNRQDKIGNAARVLGRSKDRIQIFLAICRGKKKIKTVLDLQNLSHLSNRIRVLQEAKKLVDEEIIEQLEQKVDRINAYKKIDFYCKNKTQIVKLASSPQKLSKFPTKITPHGASASKNIIIKNSGNLIKTQLITIDDVDSFSKVRKVKAVNQRDRLESQVKGLFKKILGEKGKFQDWGGEKNDLFTTRLRLKGKRISCAFGFKGKGTKGKLYPKKMGKNGDQIQRLFESPATVFLIQYVGEIDESVVEQMKIHAIARSVMENRMIYYGIIDGKDTERIFLAYS